MTNSAIVLVVDRLGAGCLGPYGNTWVPTPNFNALAARSTLFDFCLADTPDLAGAYRGFWGARHALQENTTIDGALQSIADAGVNTALITDEPGVAQMTACELFVEESLLDMPQATTSAAEIEQTALASLFADVVDTLERQESPLLLWVHARGMSAPWDAPLALRQALAAEEDPDPREDVAVPSQCLTKNYDPDELLGIVQAYAAQVMVLDECVGVLMNAIEQCPQRDELLTIVTSPRGFPLGEHLIVGDCATDLYGELLHVPLLLWRGDGQGALQRSHALTQPPDVAATLLDWFDVEMPNGLPQSLLPLTATETIDDKPVEWRDRIVCVDGEQSAIRTPAWFLRKSENDELSLEESYQLFRKPDDRWELNEVSRRCPHIVEQLETAIDECRQAMQEDRIEALTPLSDELVDGLE